MQLDLARDSFLKGQITTDRMEIRLEKGIIRVILNWNRNIAYIFICVKKNFIYAKRT